MDVHGVCGETMGVSLSVKRLKGVNKRLLLGTLIVVSILAMTVQAWSLVQTSSTVHSGGAVKAVGVGVYSDVNLTVHVTSISWGTMEPGGNVNKTVYIRNEGNVAAKLSMATSNWNPANATTYLALTWNYAGQSINKGSAIQVKFTLKLSAATQGLTNFTFDITITGTG